MGKTLNELAHELKDYIIELQSDAHNRSNLRRERYNNLKLSMDIAKNSRPHVLITIAMSNAEYDLKSGEKSKGSLGPDEKYANKWMSKVTTLPALRNCWKHVQKNN